MERNNRILIVDDQEDLRTQVAKMLQQQSAEQQTISLIEQIRNRIGRKSEQPASGHQFNYEVDTFAQGKDAYEGVKLALAENRPYALMFLDMRMPPGWDGLETAQRIRSIDKDIQIVIMTAYADYDQREIAEKVGEPDKLLYIKKPFHPEEIRQLSLALTEKWNLNRREKERLILTNRLMRENGFLTRQSFESLATTYNSILNALVSFLDAGEGIMVSREGSTAQVVASTSAETGEPLLKTLSDQQRNSPRLLFNEKEGYIILPLMFNNFDGFIYLKGKELSFTFEQLRPFLDILMETARGVLRNAYALSTQQVPDELAVVAPLLSKLTSQLEQKLTGLRKIGDELEASVSADVKTALQESLSGISTLNEKMSLLAEIGVKPFNLRPAPINVVVDKALEDLQADIKSASINLGVNIPEAVMILCDQSLLSRAIGEVISNSVKALTQVERKGKGQIQITGKVIAEEEIVRLKIIDNAGGVSSELAAHLFDPFVVGEASKGSGLGSTLARQIIRRHKGTISFASEADSGTTFEIGLPLCGTV